MSGKHRLSASVDPELIAAAQSAVAEGRAESVSAWVSDALRRQVEREHRLAALAEFVAAFEAAHGEITDEEIRDATRRAEARAVVVRGSATDAAKVERRAG